jgi:hypothetical protein
MLCLWLHPAEPEPQRLKYPQLHFGGRFARECNGDDFLGMCNDREQIQVTLNQELGLSRPSRRLHNERAPDVERIGARLFIVAKELAI